jgi:hypothetical protein
MIVGEKMLKYLKHFVSLLVLIPYLQCFSISFEEINDAFNSATHNAHWTQDAHSNSRTYKSNNRVRFQLIQDSFEFRFYIDDDFQDLLADCASELGKAIEDLTYEEFVAFIQREIGILLQDIPGGFELAHIPLIVPEVALDEAQDEKDDDERLPSSGEQLSVAASSDGLLAVIPVGHGLTVVGPSGWLPEGTILNRAPRVNRSDLIFGEDNSSQEDILNRMRERAQRDLEPKFSSFFFDGSSL